MVTIIASGPSLTTSDAAWARARTKTIAVNDSWRPAGADLLYAADALWWDHHHGVPAFPGEKWTQDKEGGAKAAARWGLRAVRGEPRAGVSFDPACIHHGWNSTFQALNLAVLFGAARILLLGLDCQATGGALHWFGNHPGWLHRSLPFDGMRAAFAEAAPQLVAAGIEVVNCSRVTALTCFSRMSIEEALPCPSSPRCSLPRSENMHQPIADRTTA